MAKDLKGNDIALDDIILLRGRARRVEDGEDGCNVLFESIDPLYPTPQQTVFWCNSAQLEGLGPEPAPAPATPAAPVVPGPAASSTTTTSTKPSEEA